MIDHFSLSPMMFSMVTLGSNHVLADPHRAGPKLVNVMWSDQLLAVAILSILLTNSLAVMESLAFDPKFYGSLVCSTLRAKAPSAPWTTWAWLIGTCPSLTGLMAGLTGLTGWT
jgi:hypothetical protein